MKQFLINTFQLTIKEAGIFSSCFEAQLFSKNERFLEHGEVCNKVGYVERGCLKCVLIDEDREFIDDFVFENHFVSNYYSFLTHR